MKFKEKFKVKMVRRGGYTALEIGEKIWKELEKNRLSYVLAYRKINKRTVFKPIR